MKLKNILITTGLILFTAFNAQADRFIENPYINVSVKHEWQTEINGTLYPQMQATQNGNFYDDKDINMPGIAIFIVVDKLLTLPIRQFSAKHSLTGQYEDKFSYKNKPGVIKYTINAMLGEKDGKRVIKSLHVKVLHASLNGVELRKQGIQGIIQSEL